MFKVQYKQKYQEMFILNQLHFNVIGSFYYDF